MAPSDVPSKAVARLKRLKAELKAKMTTQQAKSDTSVHGVPDAEPEKNGEVSNSLKLTQIQISLSLLRPLNQTQLQGDWLRDILPTQRHRKLVPSVYCIEDSTFLILSTSSLLSLDTKDKVNFERELEICKKTLGSDGMTYMRLGNGGGWCDVNGATRSVFGAMRDVLERNPAPLSLLPSAWVGQLFLSCVRIALPEDCRYRRLALRTLDWSPKENAIMLDLHLPLAFAESSHNESTVRPHSLQLAIPKDTANECAELEVDPVFYVQFSKDAEKYATNAQKGLARFVLAHCARYAVTQNEATFLAQALIDRYGKKLYTTTIHSDIFSSSPARLLQEFRQRLPDHHGPRDQSLNTRGAVEKHVRFLVEESLASQKNEEHATNRDTKDKRKAREQRTAFRKRMSELQTILSKSAMSNGSELSKPFQSSSDKLKADVNSTRATLRVVDTTVRGMGATVEDVGATLMDVATTLRDAHDALDRLEVRVENQKMFVKASLNDLRREEMVKWESLKKELMDIFDEP